MADTFTPNFDLVLPEIGGSLDTWGAKLNENFSEVDGRLIPSGLISLWSGSMGAVPDGWALCDGTNGTPDLRGRFIVGAGDAYSVGDTGGSESVTLTVPQIPSHHHTLNESGAHTHTTNTAGAHSHSASTGGSGSHSHNLSHSAGSSYISSGRLVNRVLNTGNAQGGTLGHYRGQANGDGPTEYVSINGVGNHTHSVSINSNGGHMHTVNSSGAHTHVASSTGGGEAHENRPPYYALAYIMKL